MQSHPAQNATIAAFQDVMNRGILFKMFETNPDSVIIFDGKSLHVLSANKQARQQHGDLRQLRKQTMVDLVDGIDPDRIRRLAQTIQKRRNSRTQIQIKAQGETLRLLNVQILCVHYPEPTIIACVSDITSQLKARQTATNASKRFATAIDALSDGFVLYDEDDRLVICNETYRQIYRRSAPAMVVGNTFEEILRYGLANGQYSDAVGREDHWLAERLAAHNTENVTLEQQLTDGRWLRIVERDTGDGGRVGLRVDITRMKEQQAVLDRLASTDDLTGLQNRRNLAAKVSGILCGLPEENRVAAFHVDLDRFKMINDLNGHEAGDFVLNHCANILRSNLCQRGFAARLGGDDFLLICEVGRLNPVVLRFAHQLIAQIMSPIVYQDRHLHIGASIGIAFLSPGPDADPIKLISAAGIALCEAKKGDSESVVVYEPQMRAKSLHENQLSKELALALERDEFVPFFQPQIDVVSGQVIGFEALIRWQHPLRGPVSAGEFLPIAKAAGLMKALDSLMMDQTCAAIRHLINIGVRNPSISINLSYAQLSDTRLVQRLHQAMSAHGIKHENLRLELLESTLFDDRNSTFTTNVHALVNDGFIVELDDFGTGHAAIASLRRFKVGQIKIDRSFVQNINNDIDLQKLTGAIIALAKSLDIPIIAEGVETTGEQQSLLKMGCPLAQGYLHGRPMALADLPGFLATYAALTKPANTLER